MYEISGNTVIDHFNICCAHTQTISSVNKCKADIIRLLLSSAWIPYRILRDLKEVLYRKAPSSSEMVNAARDSMKTFHVSRKAPHHYIQ